MPAMRATNYLLPHKSIFDSMCGLAADLRLLEDSDMTLRNGGMRTFSIACAIAVVSALSGCGGSTGAAGAVATAGSGSGGSAPATITGITTPKSVSVVTAN
jgi:hypothetical protein